MTNTKNLPTKLNYIPICRHSSSTPSSLKIKTVLYKSVLIVKYFINLLYKRTNNKLAMFFFPVLSKISNQ